MSYVYCTYLSFYDVVAPMGAVAHYVREGRFLLMYVGRVCSFVATMIAVTVGPAVLRGARGQRLGTSTAPTGDASVAAAAFVVSSIIWSVGKFYGLDLGEKSLHMRLHRGVGLIG